MKLGIIGGAGLLGATTAFCTAESGLFNEIILTDTRENLAASHAMDIGQAVCELSATSLRVGTPDDLSVCDVILNTAGIPEVKAASRDAYLAGNIVILRELAERIRRWKASPVFLTATNPIDVINYRFFELSGLPREKCIGFSRNDTLRFIWAAAKETGIPASELTALVIGEHGDYQVPLFSTLRRRDTGEALLVSGAQRESISGRVKTWFAEYQQLDSGRSSGWTSGVWLAHILKLIATGSDEICPCSVVPDGEYGLSGLSIGLPIKLGPGGVREIAEIPLEDDERAELGKAAEKITGLIGASANM